MIKWLWQTYFCQHDMEVVDEGLNPEDFYRYETSVCRKCGCVTGWSQFDAYACMQSANNRYFDRTYRWLREIHFDGDRTDAERCAASVLMQLIEQENKHAE